MRRVLVSFLALMFSCVGSFAQEKSFSFDFTYVLNTGVPVNGSGSALVRGDSYHIVMDGVDYWCDGKTCWIVDTGSKEVYVDYPGDFSYYLQNSEISYTGKSPSQAVIKMKDGSTATLSIMNYVSNPPVNQSFVFNTSALSSDYIVTDVR